MEAEKSPAAGGANEVLPSREPGELVCKFWCVSQRPLKVMFRVAGCEQRDQIPPTQISGFCSGSQLDEAHLYWGERTALLRYQAQPETPSQTIAQ